MNIEIVTAPIDDLNENELGLLKHVSLCWNRFYKTLHRVRLNKCKDLTDLDLVLHRRPDIVMLGVKYIPLENSKKIWLSEFFETQNLTKQPQT